MHDFGNLLTIIILQVAVAVLVMTWLRSRTPLSFQWAVGWLLVLVRAGLVAAAPWGGATAAFAADCCLEIAALLFLDSLVGVNVSAKIAVPMAWICAVPLALFTAGVHRLPHGVPPGKFLLGALAAAALAAGIWAIRSGILHKSLPLSLIMVTTFMAGNAARAHHPGDALALVMAALFCAVGVAIVRTYSLRSPGTLLAGFGFFANSALALLLPLPVLLARRGMLARGPEVAWILTAVGMAILLIEDEARSVKRLQQRERLIREELQHYAAVQVSLQVDANEEAIYKAACEAIARFSPFREVAMLKRDSGGRPKAVCHSALQVANVAGIETLTQRFTTGDPMLLVSFQGAKSVVVRSKAPARLNSHKTPGRSLIVSLPAQSGKSQGWLWLANPVKGWPDITAEQLLPLESLASRLAVSMENRELTRMLIRNDKLAGLGKLAGGVAHELNNPLTVVCGYTELIHESTLEPSTRKQTAKVLAEAMRMKRIIEDLNRFSKPPTSEYGTHDLVELMKDVGQSLKSDLIRRGVSFELHTTRASVEVHGCRDSLHQIFFQLVLNAAEAIERGGKGPQSGRAGCIRAEVDQNDGSAIVLVSDTGPGFAEPERIFDPFYTTKDPGEGPGLGLSVSYGLVQEHQGSIHAYNMQPGGAAVCVTLPRVAAQLAPVLEPKRAGATMTLMPMAVAQPA
jgi:two-component system NtrC family sensor kinase